MFEPSAAVAGVKERLEKAASETAVVAPAEESPWRRWEVWAYLILIATALSMRLWDLGAQALHHDESLHATYAWYLFQGRGYVHDPMMHGPFQFSGTAVMFFLFGDSDFTVRLLPALFGTALVGLPVLLRRRLGRYGALVTSVLLTVSPTMLYFSRFARNDVYMAVWAMALVAVMWRYLDTRRIRYLVWASVILALALATKETAYIVAMILGSYLFIQASTDVFPWLLGRKRLRDFSPSGEFLVLLGTLMLPVTAAGLAVFQGGLGLTLANPDPASAPVGIPIGSGLYVAFLAVSGAGTAAVALGLCWRPKVWLVCFGAFATIWVLLYTTAFTNFLPGLTSGLWRGLGYWVVQQDVARGDQPWYYYLVLGLNYEFLPMLLGAAALVVYGLRGDSFSRFLVFWAVFNFILYTYASEKMPWLLVNVTLPFILLTGKLLGDLIERRPWLRTFHDQGEDRYLSAWIERIHWPAVAFMAMGALLVALIGRWLLAALPEAADVGVRPLVLVVVLIPALLAACGYLLRQVPVERRGALVGLSLGVVMIVLTISVAFRASYLNADIPVEMLVYTQTSPDIPQVVADIQRLSEESGKDTDLKITVDGTTGFSWPWVWYLRDYPNVSHPCFSTDAACSPMSEPPDSDVLLLASSNRSSAQSHLSDYGRPVEYKHRWWFPESYRGLDPTSVVAGLVSREAWCGMVSYFFNREFGQPIGSMDGYAYFPKGFVPTGVESDVVPSNPGC